MASKISVTMKGKKAKRGERMRSGKGWRLAKGNKVFVGTLLDTFNLGAKRIAIYSVPK
jgi:hypothetical protein